MVIYKPFISIVKISIVKVSIYLLSQDTFLVPNKLASENYLTTVQLDFCVLSPIQGQREVSKTRKCLGERVSIRPESLH